MARLDTGWHANPKVLRAGAHGMALHAWSISYCDDARSDGFIPADAWPALLKAGVKPLVQAGLWEAIDGGYRLHDYLSYNRSRAEIAAEQDMVKVRRDLYADGELRTAIRNRDGDSCRYCAVGVDWRDRKGPRGATYDHVDPSGGNALDNVVVACRACNAAKGQRTPADALLTLLAPPPKSTRNQLRSTPKSTRNQLENLDSLARAAVPGPGPGVNSAGMTAGLSQDLRPETGTNSRRRAAALAREALETASRQASTFLNSENDELPPEVLSRLAQTPLS
jgi:hypothetical protein